MDITVLIIMCVFTIMLGIISLMGSRSLAWGTFAFFGAILGAYCFIALAADGSLTNGATVLAYAGTNDWKGLVLLPLLLAMMDLIFGILAMLRKFGVNI